MRRGGGKTTWLLCLLAGLLFLFSCAPKASLSQLEANATLSEEGDGSVPLERELSTDPNQDRSSLSGTEQEVLKSRFGLDFDLDLHDTKEVRRYFTFFTHTARNTFAKWLKRSEPYLPYVRKAFTRHGLPQDLVLLPFAESGYNVWACSWAGAAGMWQFMPFTGRKYGLRSDWWIDERRDPCLATESAAKYLSDLYAQFGDWYLALAAYNAGEGKISRALEKTNANDFFELAAENHRLRGRAKLRKETRNYVPKFIAISKIFQNLEALGFEPVNWDAAEDFEDLEVPGGTDLLALAKAGDMRWDDFHRLNPAFRRQVSPPDTTCVAHVPREKVGLVLAYLKSPGSRPYAGYICHAVRSGDSWYRISRRYGVPVSVLKMVNNTRSNLLRPGQRVMVPGRESSRPVLSADAGAEAGAEAGKVRSLALKRGNYVVRRGDTMWDISRRFGVGLDTLLKANGMNRRTRLRVGQKVYVPDGGGQATRLARKEAEKVKETLVRYQVRKGDNLWSISKRFGVSADALMEWNALNERAVIRPGDSLKVYVR
ncbi:MAG: LysM peptidoglycan-binding domain-containing protein [Desulfovibrionaceae bacterium]|nr:LysM peptidoglycan-binding domain-containing protein [Desulfovibrionaceae bacterium]